MHVLLCAFFLFPSTFSLVAFSLVPLSAQSAPLWSDGDTRTAETRHLTLKTSAEPDTVAPGGRVRLSVRIAPKARMHVYSPEQPDVIAVTFDLAPGGPFRAEAIRYPPPERYFFAPLQETQRVYSQPFTLTRRVTIPAAARLPAPGAGGMITIRGTVRYQACDDAVCYLPQDVPVSWQVRIAERDQTRTDPGPPASADTIVSP